MNNLRLLRTARSGRPIIALDGCVLYCVKACLDNANVSPRIHITLSALGVKKRKHSDFDCLQAAEVYAESILPTVRALEPAEISPKHAIRAPLGT